MEPKHESSPSYTSSLASSCRSLHSVYNVHVGVQKRKAGRKKFQETRHPVYRGVRRRKGKWVCELRHPSDKSRIWLGTFTCPDMAARAHDVAALALWKDAAALNFPETAHLLPQATSSSVKDIQCAALKAAKSTGGVHVLDCLPEYCSPLSRSCPSSGESEEKYEGAVGGIFWDEEELFNMPVLLDSMAEGLILTPPGIRRGFNWDDYEENAVDLTLWSA